MDFRSGQLFICTETYLGVFTLRVCNMGVWNLGALILDVMKQTTDLRVYYLGLVYTVGV